MEGAIAKKMHRSKQCSLCEVGTGRAAAAKGKGGGGVLTDRGRCSSNAKPELSGAPREGRWRKGRKGDRNNTSNMFVLLSKAKQKTSD